MSYCRLVYFVQQTHNVFVLAVKVHPGRVFRSGQFQQYPCATQQSATSTYFKNTKQIYSLDSLLLLLDSTTRLLELVEEHILHLAHDFLHRAPHFVQYPLLLQFGRGRRLPFFVGVDGQELAGPRFEEEFALLVVSEGGFVFSLQWPGKGREDQGK